MSDVTWNPAGDDDTSFGPLTAHNVLGGRTAADAHPAAAVSYDNDVSGLTGDTVQEAIDELATSGGAVSSVNGETGVVVLDAADVGAVPVESVGLLPGETNRGTWDVAETYAVGDVVFEVGGGLYVATAPSTGAQPSLTPGSWDVLDPTGRRIHLGPAATSGDGGLSVGYAATSGAGGLSVGTAATSGDGGLSVGTVATAGDGGLSVGTFATAGEGGLSVGTGATAGDYEVNVANIYKGTLDPGDLTTPLTATIATGHVDLPETADATNPPADHQRLIARTDGLYVRDETGTEVGPLGAAHAASHQDGGSDELALDGSQITTGTVAAARLGSGTASAGTVLHGDGAWRRGHVDAVVNAATFPGNAPIGPNHAPTFASASHSLGAVGHEAYVPFFCPVGTYDSIGLNVTATAASTWRIGVADMASTGWPGEILLDAGTLDMSSATGWRALAIGFVVDRPRWMWMQVKCTAYTAAPTVTCLDGISSASSSPRLPGWPVYGSLLARAFVGCRTIQNRGSGPLDPAAPMTNGDAGAGLGFNQIMPLIVMRRSA